MADSPYFKLAEALDTNFQGIPKKDGEFSPSFLEYLELLFTPEADLSGAMLRLRGADNEAWAGLIGRVKSGEIAKERSRPKDEAVLEAARAAPTKCTTCGAALDVEIVRGMREITCEYCGTVIRL